MTIRLRTEPVPLSMTIADLRRALDQLQAAGAPDHAVVRIQLARAHHGQARADWEAASPKAAGRQ